MIHLEDAACLAKSIAREFAMEVMCSIMTTLENAVWPLKSTALDVAFHFLIPLEVFPPIYYVYSFISFILDSSMCSGHGYCNGKTCVCDVGFAGTVCNSCAPDYYVYPVCRCNSLYILGYLY
jgi:hypothetical protein